MRTEARSCKPSDLPSIARLLTAAGLPVPAPDDPAVEFVVIADEDGIAACAGWEIHGGQALLRSVVVREGARSCGLGGCIVRDALRTLEDRGVRDVTLVTLDAEALFAPMGFEPIERESVPEPIRASPEFLIHHCANGLWMRLRL